MFEQTLFYSDFPWQNSLSLPQWVYEMKIKRLSEQFIILGRGVQCTLYIYSRVSPAYDGEWHSKINLGQILPKCIRENPKYHDEIIKQIFLSKSHIYICGLKFSKELISKNLKIAPIVL